MTRKWMWPLAIICLIGYLLFWHFQVQSFNFSDIFESIGFISALFTVLLLTFVLSLIVSLVPYRHLGFGAKLLRALPLSLILVCLIFGLSFFVKGPSFKQVKTASDEECRKVKTGLFKLDNSWISRTDSTQTETDIVTNETVVFRIRWINDCEYRLSNEETTYNVKIIKVDQQGYTCFVQHEGKTYRNVKVLFRQE